LNRKLLDLITYIPTRTIKIKKNLNDNVFLVILIQINYRFIKKLRAEIYDKNVVASLISRTYTQPIEKYLSSPISNKKKYRWKKILRDVP